MAVKQKSGHRLWTEVVSQVTHAINTHQQGYLQVNQNIDQRVYAHAHDDWDNITRPRWFDGIRIFVHTHAGLRDVNNIPMTQCANCHKWCSIQGLQIDHNGGWHNIVNNWKQSGQRMTNLEARIAYNDPNNLALVCAICNQSHPEFHGPSLGTRLQAARNVDEKIALLLGRLPGEPD